MFGVLKAIFFEDLPLKIVCVAIAALLWVYIDGELMGQRDFEIAVRPADVALPPGLELAPNRALPAFLVRIRGPRRKLQLMTKDNVGFSQKLLENPRPGRNALQPNPGDIAAEGADVVSVIPKNPFEEPAVELIATIQKIVPVRVKIKGAPREGRILQAPAIEPSQVKISGSKEDLERVEFAWTEEVDVTNAEQDVIRDVAIAPSIVEGNGPSFRSTDKVRVTIPVRPKRATRQMTLDVRTYAIPGMAMTVEPKSVEVEVTGEEQDITAPDIAAQLVLYVDWPRGWEKPNDPQAVLGPLSVPLKAIAPPRVQVRGTGGGVLPNVQVRAALAGALSKSND